MFILSCFYLSKHPLVDGKWQKFSHQEQYAKSQSMDLTPSVKCHTEEIMTQISQYLQTQAHTHDPDTIWRVQTPLLAATPAKCALTYICCWQTTSWATTRWTVYCTLKKREEKTLSRLRSAASITCTLALCADFYQVSSSSGRCIDIMFQFLLTENWWSNLFYITTFCLNC